MTHDLFPGLRAFVDDLAARGVTRLSVKQGDQRLDLTLGQPDDTAPPPAPAKPAVAPGPGVFHHAHPAHQDAPPCLQSGHFLFPLDLPRRPSFLADDGAVVGFGTALAAPGDSQ
ncbi:hypothetical protein [Roseovarius sp.]|uniref:hypothetical protein n=1 Tax=Roseovarius sp. TaxID=1486281 RepID=UPI00257A6FF2|nr:hypothetical protein [Roseovarius sp.]